MKMDMKKMEGATREKTTKKNIAVSSRMRLKRILIAAAVIFIAAAAGCIWYVNDYYRSDQIVKEYLKGSDQVAVVQIDEGLFLDGSGEEKAMIFYPGAKVEYTAYAPVFMGLAERGVDCFLVKMPFNLAILGANKADQIMARYDYSQWYLSGHSLGGAMAAGYAADHCTEDNHVSDADMSGEAGHLSGLAILAAYPTKDIADNSLSVVSIYGSEDLVLNRESLENGWQWMPDNYKTVCIEGGNHAQFGAYGPQKGDGQASITAQEQWQQTIDALLQMMEVSPALEGGISEIHDGGRGRKLKEELLMNDR